MYITAFFVEVFWYTARVWAAKVFWNSFIVDHTSATNISWWTAFICVVLLNIVCTRVSLTVKDGNIEFK